MLRGAVGSLLPLALLAGCARIPVGLQDILDRRVLNVVTLNGPTTYYEGAHGPQGAEFRLASAYAASLGVKLHIYAVRDYAALRHELDRGRADIAAAAITSDARWDGFSIAGAAYDSIPQLVACRRGRKGADSLADLAGRKLAVRADSAQRSTLESLPGGAAAAINWVELSQDGGDPLLAVAEGDADCGVVDATAFVYSRHLYPDVAVAFSPPVRRPVHWMVVSGAFDLASNVDAYFKQLRANDRLAALLRESQPEPQEFRYEVARAFQADIAARLPALQPWFEEAAELTGVDWRLLAALAYQESKWEASARSDDGARGIMMLTDATARSLDVVDRDDPRASILAGARYFVATRAKIPARVREPDRTWLALAAYNTGFAHLEDARVLTQSRKKNPDLWSDVRESLPLLEQERYYLKAKHGYARGSEPVRLVEQIQLFLNLFEWGGAPPMTLPAQETEAVEPDVQPLASNGDGNGRA